MFMCVHVCVPAQLLHPGLAALAVGTTMSSRHPHCCACTWAGPHPLPASPPEPTPCSLPGRHPLPAPCWGGSVPPHGLPTGVSCPISGEAGAWGEGLCAWAAWLYHPPGRGGRAHSAPAACG